MARRRGRPAWMQEHLRDPYVKQAQEQGYRSRAVFKLRELNDRDSLFRPGLTVVDLGAAPGGWCQFVKQRIDPGGRVIAVDLRAIEPIPGVEFIQGDLRAAATIAALRQRVGASGADLVMSDMAPNMTGVRSVDQPRAMDLAEEALNVARELLSGGGSLLVKVFQGSGYADYRGALRASFGRVAVRKPRASKDESREVYLFARDYRL